MAGLGEQAASRRGGSSRRCRTCGIRGDSSWCRPGLLGEAVKQGHRAVRQARLAQVSHKSLPKKAEGLRPVSQAIRGPKRGAMTGGRRLRPRPVRRAGRGLPSVGGVGTFGEGAERRLLLDARLRGPLEHPPGSRCTGRSYTAAARGTAAPSCTSSSGLPSRGGSRWHIVAARRLRYQATVWSSSSTWSSSPRGRVEVLDPVLSAPRRHRVSLLVGFVVAFGRVPSRAVPEPQGRCGQPHPSHTELLEPPALGLYVVGDCPLGGLPEVCPGGGLLQLQLTGPGRSWGRSSKIGASASSLKSST